jgi:methyl-accepting chemotaxis protein
MDQTTQQNAALVEQSAAAAEKLRTGAIADHVNAHERLSAEDSARLVQWLADGAP